MKAFLESFKAKLIAWGPLGMFVVCLVDGAGLPNPSGPDLILILLSIADPESAFYAAAFGVVGSILGNLIFYSIARKGGEIYLNRHTEGERGRKFRQWFNHYGLITVFVPALVPIPMPLKAFVICAGALRINVVHFAAVIGVARALRYFGIAWLGRALGSNSEGWLKTHFWHLVAGALVLFALLFLLVKFAERRRDKLAAS